MAKHKRCTGARIAELAGVSRSTVSRVVNNYDNVPEATKKRVLAAIEQEGYYPAFSEQAFASRRTKCLGLFWIRNSAIACDALASLYLATVIESAVKLGYAVLSFIFDDISEESNRQRVRAIFKQGHIDAGIFIGMDNSDPFIETLLKEGELVGLFDYQYLAKEEKNRYTVNFEADTGEKAVEYAVKMGHDRIAVIDGNLNRCCCVRRHEGFLTGMMHNGIQIRSNWLRYGGLNDTITLQGGYNAAKSLLSATSDDLPTIILCNNDAAALGTYRAIQEKGLRVGKDISILGIDGSPLADTADPPLTTFAFDFSKMFYSLVHRLVRVLDGEENVPYDEVIPSVLRERASVARL